MRSLRNLTGLALPGVLALSVLTASPAQASALPEHKRLMITSCVVLFATKSSGSSATRNGLFDNRAASQVTVSALYEIEGVEEATFQSLADQVCGSAPAQLTAAGFEIVPFEAGGDAKALEDYLKGGKASPVSKTIDNITYLAYAPTGQLVLDPALVSRMGQFKHPYAEATLAKQADAQPVRITYTVDFAAVQSNEDKGRLARLGGQRNAEVSAEVSLAIGATVLTYDGSKTKCWKSLGGREQCENNNAIPGPNSKAVVYTLAEERTYADPILDVQDSTNKAGKVAQGAVNALAMVAGSRRQKYTEFAVTVDPALYQARTLEGTTPIMDEALAWLANPPEKGKKKR